MIVSVTGASDSRAARQRGERRRLVGRMLGGMWALLIILLILWAGLAVFGFVVKGLLWLAVLGIVLFLATLVIGMLRRAGAKN